jgi:hypothetical protein
VCAPENELRDESEMPNVVGLREVILLIVVTDFGEVL